MRQDERDVYVIPPNFIEGGTLMGGMVKTRNAVEAGVLGALTALPVLQLNLSLTVRIIILCLTTLPLVLVALIGIGGQSLSQFIFQFILWLHNRRVLDQSGAGAKKGLLPSWAQKEHTADPELEELPKSHRRFQVDVKRREVTQHKTFLEREEVVKPLNPFAQVRKFMKIIHTYSLLFIACTPLKRQCDVLISVLCLNGVLLQQALLLTALFQDLHLHGEIQLVIIKQAGIQLFHGGLNTIQAGNHLSRGICGRNTALLQANEPLKDAAQGGQIVAEQLPGLGNVLRLLLQSPQDLLDDMADALAGGADLLVFYPKGQLAQLQQIGPTLGQQRRRMFGFSLTLLELGFSEGEKQHQPHQ